MQKSLLLLFISLLLFASCEKGCQNKSSALAWSNNYHVSFDKMELSISGNYYVVNSGKGLNNLKVSNSKPIENFWGVFNYPVSTGVNVESEVIVTATVDAVCLYNQTEELYAVMPQHYKVFGNNTCASPPKTFHNSRNYMTIKDKGMDYWYSNRGTYHHSYTIEIKSGPYEGDNNNRYNLIWTWYGDRNTLESTDLVVDGYNTYVKRVKGMGAPINITPNVRFTDLVYVGNTLSTRTIENVQTSTATLASAANATSASLKLSVSLQ